MVYNSGWDFLNMMKYLSILQHLFSDIIPDLAKDRQLKPWLTNSKDLDVEMRELGLRKKDLKLDEKNPPVVLDVVNNPVDRVSIQMKFLSNSFQLVFSFQLTAKYFENGSYLRPHDMFFCIERTKFTEDKILAWFKKYSIN